MRTYLLYTLVITLLYSGSSYAQEPSITRWKKAVVKVESIQQRYTPEQVDVLLQKKLDSIKHGISQHETYDIRDGLAGIRDTMRGTGLFIADGVKIYLVTAKHIIRATELSKGLETITDLVTIRADVADKKTNDIYLLNLTTGFSKYKPFILSSDDLDLGIISFQKNGYKAIVAYLMQIGVVPMPIISIQEGRGPGNGIFTIGFPGLSGSKKAELSNGKMGSADKSSFTAEMPVYPGNSGGPVIMNNKLIGILGYPAGITNKTDAATHPFVKTNSATVINASVIIPLLRKLQANERNPTFNK